MRWRLLLCGATLASALLLFPTGAPRGADDKAPGRDELLTRAVAELVKIQEDGGAWPYEGVYRVEKDIPIGYRVGGTAIAAGTLLHAAPDDKAARQAVERGLAFVLKGLDHPLMAPSTRDGYDVRVWGQACALEFLCQVRQAKAQGDRAKDVAAWIPKLVETLLTEELPGGGWNYASRQRPASFVTAPVVQALLWARGQDEKVPDAVFERSRKVLEAARTTEGAFAYSGGAAREPGPIDKPAGSSARSAVCETTLLLLGGGSTERVRSALDAFHTHWDELARRRRQTGTHEGPFRIAPYFFYYGHRYAAQAIVVLPEKEQAKERRRLEEVLLKTRDEDGTWNDRVFARSRAYGTSMAVLVLLGDRAPLPPRWEKK
jgi:hypothetical protein